MCLVLVFFSLAGLCAAAPVRVNHSCLSTGAQAPAFNLAPQQRAMSRGVPQGRGSDQTATKHSDYSNPTFFNSPLLLQGGSFESDFQQQQVLFLKGQAREAPLWQKPQVIHSYYRGPAACAVPVPYKNLHVSCSAPATRSHSNSWQTQRQPPCPQSKSRSRKSRSDGVDGLVSNFQELTFASRTLEQGLLELLGQLKPGDTEIARKLAHKLQVKKKEVNHHLYRLFRQGKVCKTGELPPLWSIAAAHHLNSLGGGSDLQGAVGRVSSSESSDEGSCATDPDDSNMAEIKEKICSFLYSVADSTAHNLAKNVGLSKARDVNTTLNNLEKLGDVHKENTAPPKWSLTDSKRKRMQLKLKAQEVGELAPPAMDSEPEPTAPCVEAERPVVVPTPPLPSSPLTLPLREEEGEKVENGQQPSEQAEPGGGSKAAWTGPPRSKRARYPWFPNYDNFENGKWATDDIPEDLNAISNQDESRCIMASPLSPSYAAQFDTAFLCTPMEKLLACQKKNPVSGLIEYTQYTYQHCEFVLLKQSGPSHEPR